MARTVNVALKLQNRKKILDSAVRLFATKGYFSTTITEIAKEAGMSHAAIFTYFSNKEELLDTIILDPLVEEQERLRELLGLNGAPGQILERIVEEQIGSLIQRGSYLRIAQNVLAQPAYFERQSKAIFDFAADMVAKLAGLIEQGQKNGEIAEGDAIATGWSYFSYINGLGLIVQDPNPSSEMIREFMSRGCRLIGIVNRR